VMGHDAKDECLHRLPEIKKDLGVDFLIVNGENSERGNGITAKICHEFYNAGVDCITTGNHVWDQREILSYIKKDPKLLRPINYPKESPGQGVAIIEANNKKLLVVNAIGRKWMSELTDDPFAAMNELLEKYKLGENIDAIFVDFHAEVTSEKMAMGQYCDGRVTAVVGTHSHIPTADLQILPNGTAYQTDAGMVGPYHNSVIGLDKDIAVRRFTVKVPHERFRPAEGEITICGVLVETDNQGLCLRTAPLRTGGSLFEAIPNWT